MRNLGKPQHDSITQGPNKTPNQEDWQDDWVLDLWAAGLFVTGALIGFVLFWLLPKLLIM